MRRELEKIKKKIFGRKKLTLLSTKNDIRNGRLVLSNPDSSITALVSFGPLSRMLNYRQGLREYARVMKRSAVAALGIWTKRSFDFKGTQYYHQEQAFRQELWKFFSVKAAVVLFNDGERKFIVFEVRK